MAELVDRDFDLDLDVIDEFCGAGGASEGLRRAGFRLVLGINHWDRAVETHAANFPDADHWCEDTSRLDMRRLPRARGLWASPICTESSPAGGKKRSRKQVKGQGELELFGHVPKAGMIRTRTTFYDVLRSVEVQRFDFVLIENVVEVADDWELFDWWVEAMKRLGYNVQFVSVSAAHVGGDDNEHAPQWRDRLYLVFTRIGIALPDVDPRPLAWCEPCGEDTYALQSWKKLHNGRRIGKYVDQYVYVCERSACRHARVEPYVLPAASAIDWTDLGERIGDKRSRRADGLPLAPNTLRRIEVGLARFAQTVTLEASGNTYERPGSGYVRAWPAHAAPTMTMTTDRTKGIAIPPTLLAVNHDGDGRAFPVDARPLPTRTIKLGEGLALPPMIDVARTHNRARGVDEPVAPLTTGRNHSLVCPPFITELRGGGSTARRTSDPLATMVASGRHHMLTVPPGNAPVIDRRLVIPYRRGARPYSAASGPLSTVLTESQHGLAELGVDVMDCRFRMLQPRETLRAQRFPDEYRVVGNGTEQYALAGNAVAANVAQWLGTAIRAVLDGRKAS